MSNMGYALGDIKMNSLVNILKGLFIGVFYYFAAKYHGISGILSAMLVGNIIIDFSYFSYRLHQLGYLDNGLIKQTLLLWSMIVPLLLVGGIGCNMAVNAVVANHLYVLKLFINGGAFVLLFMAVVLTIDRVVRGEVLRSIKRYLPVNVQEKKN